MDKPLVQIQPVYSLRQLITYFFKLGYSGFGGPVALVGHMHRDLVEGKRWIPEEDYKQGLALAQLAPGPLAAQLCIYLGFVHYKIVGATLTGLAFILPSFVMVLGLGMIYKLYGGLNWMQAIFYGVGAAVVGIIILSSYRLTIRSVSKISLHTLRSNWLLWLLYLIAGIITVLTRSEQMMLFVFAGLIYMIYKSPPRGIKNANPLKSIFLYAGIGFWNYESGTLVKIGLFFLKAGAFVFGSGLAIVPFLHSGVVSQYHWLTEEQFVDAVAVAMITPGPVVITVGFIGYLVGGFPGACVASVATFLPCYLFTILPAPYFKKIAKNSSIIAFVEGITAAVIGALAGAVLVMASRSIRDTPTAIIALLTLLTMIYLKKIKEPLIILVAAVAGITLKLLFK